MTNNVQHDSVEIDLEDPKAYLKALRRIEFLLGTGQSVVRAKVADDDVEYSAASMTWVQNKIKELEAVVGRQNGRRNRFAVKVSFR
jgi:hypothetical protein